MRIDDFFEEHKTEVSRCGDLLDRCKQLRDRIRDLRSESIKATASGDRNNFRTILNEIDDHEKDISRLEAELTCGMVDADENDLLTVWDEYADQHEAALQKKLDAVREARKVLRYAFEDALRTENDALRMRDLFSGASGVPISKLRLANIPDEGKQLPPMLIRIPEVHYLACCGEWERDPSPDGNDAIGNALDIVNGRHAGELHF